MSAVLAQTEAAVQRQALQHAFDRYHAAWEAKDPDAIVALHLVTRKDVWVDGVQRAAAFRRAGRTH